MSDFDASFEMTAPRAARFTLSITMDLGQWITLRGHLTNAYPDWKLSDAISEMVRQAEQAFSPPKE